MNRPPDRRQVLGLLCGTPLAVSILPRQEAGASEPYPIRPIDEATIPARFRRRIVASPDPALAGAILVDAADRLLYLGLEDGRAIRYGVAVGREGQAWSGAAIVGRKAKWPGWTPTQSMLRNQPGLSYSIDGGPGNPLGARALYLYQGGKDTLYRVHGGCEPRLLGRTVSSGCIRMLDQDIVDLFDRVPLGTRVLVRG